MARNTITLTEVGAFKVTVSTDDRAGYEVKGYYKDPNIAATEAKGAGWWGRDGTVDVVTLHQDGEGQLYDVVPLGKFTDEEAEFKQKTIESIKSKLNDAELALLGLS